MPIFGLQPAGLLQTIFEDIGVAVAVIDRDERVVFANRTALELFETNEDGNAVHFRSWLQHCHFENSDGSEIPIEKSAVMRAMRGERIESQELRVEMPDGRTKWILDWAYHFASMGLEGVITLIVDQTFEIQLRKAAAQLQRMETMGSLAAGLTHDFNNMLNAIATNIAIVSVDPSCSPAVHARLEQISDAAEKAAGLVRRLMQFSRTQDLHQRSLRVNDVVHEALRLVHPLLRDNILLALNLGDHLPPIHGDSSQIEQVLVNLIVNAVDAMPAGGELQVSTARSLQPQRACGLEKLQEFVSIAIGDTGVGIPDELQSAVFEPFFTTKPKGKGTGLGLSSSYGIVRQHDGRIELQSKAGYGSTFIVSFPAEDYKPSE